MYKLNMQSETLPHDENRVDLDPDRHDAWGLPLPRLTFTYHENERRLHRFLTGIGEGIMRETGATTVWSARPKSGNDAVLTGDTARPDSLGKHTKESRDPMGVPAFSVES